MKLSWPLALASLLLVVASARAEFIPWATWMPDSPQSFVFLPHARDKNGSTVGYVNAYFYPPKHSGTGSMNNFPLMGFLATGSNAATLPNSWYEFYMALQDRQSGQVGYFHFGGSIGGNIYNLSNKNVSNTLSNPVESITLGQHTYTMTINPFVPPTELQPRSVLTANLVVTGPDVPPFHNAPEPASMVLIGLGLATLGARCWWRKVRPACP